MAKDVLYPIKYGFPFYKNLLFLGILGYYPMNQNYNRRHYFGVLFVWNLIWGANSLNIGGVLIKEVLYISDGTLNQITSTLTIFLVMTSSMTCCTFFSINHEKWSQLFKRIADHSKFGKPPNFDKIRTKQDRAAIVCIIYSSLGVIFAPILVLLQEPSCSMIPGQKSCGLVTPIIWPRVDEITLLTKRLILFYQFLCCWAIVCFLSPLLIVLDASNYIGARADHLADLFSELYSIQDAEEQFKQFRIWVQYHQNTISLCEQFKKDTKSTIGYMTMMYPIMLGCLAHQLTKASDEKLSLFLIPLFSVGCFICHSGQIIESKMSSIGDSIYMSQWNKCDLKIRELIPFILLRCQVRIGLETYPLNYPNYNLLITMLKASYSYLTLFNNI